MASSPGRPAGPLVNSPTSPVRRSAFTTAAKSLERRFFDEDQFIIKFNNFWTIQLPPGYSVLVSHPINRDDLPFRALSGLVDCDRYHDAFVQFPARWVDPNFNGVLPKGTPVVQCVPVKRETWALQFENLTDADKKHVYDTGFNVSSSIGLYRQQFRAPKR
jgi:hypothetical protein